MPIRRPTSAPPERTSPDTPMRGGQGRRAAGWNASTEVPEATRDDVVALRLDSYSSEFGKANERNHTPNTLRAAGVYQRSTYMTPDPWQGQLASRANSAHPWGAPHHPPLEQDDLAMTLERVAEMVGVSAVDDGELEVCAKRLEAAGVTPERLRWHAPALHERAASLASLADLCALTNSLEGDRAELHLQLYLRKVKAYLSDTQRCQLLDYDKAMALTPELVQQLYDQGGAGLDTLRHLRHLSSEDKLRAPDALSLVDAVQKRHQIFTAANKATENVVRCLGELKEALFHDSFGAQFAPDKVHATKLLKFAKAHVILAHLRTMASRGEAFADFAALAKGVEKSQQRVRAHLQHDKVKLLQVLEARCNEARAASPGSRPLSLSVTLPQRGSMEDSDLERLLLNGKGLQTTLFHLASCDGQQGLQLEQAVGQLQESLEEAAEEVLAAVEDAIEDGSAENTPPRFAFANAMQLFLDSGLPSSCARQVVGLTRAVLQDKGFVSVAQLTKDVRTAVRRYILVRDATMATLRAKNTTWFQPPERFLGTERFDELMNQLDINVLQPASVFFKDHRDLLTIHLEKLDKWVGEDGSGGRRFQDFDGMCKRLNELFSSFRVHQQALRENIRAWLSQHRARLFFRRTLSEDAHERQVDALLSAGRTPVALTHYLKQILARRQRFGSFMELVQCVAALYSQDLQRTYTFLSGPRSRLLRLSETPREHVKLGQAELDALFVLGAGVDTMRLLATLDAAGLHVVNAGSTEASHVGYEAVRQLVAAMRVLQQRERDQDQKALQDILGKFSDNHGDEFLGLSKASGLGMDLSTEDIEAVLPPALGAERALKMLLDMQAVGLSFQSLNDLGESLGRSADYATRVKDLALVFLSHQATPLLPMEQRHLLLPYDVEQLVRFSGAEGAVLQHLWAMTLAGEKYGSLNELAEALRLRHLAQLRDRPIAHLAKYLAGPKCASLWTEEPPEEGWITEHDVCRLLEASGHTHRFVAGRWALGPWESVPVQLNHVVRSTAVEWVDDSVGSADTNDQDDEGRMPEYDPVSTVIAYLGEASLQEAESASPPGARHTLSRTKGGMDALIDRVSRLHSEAMQGVQEVAKELASPSRPPFLPDLAEPSDLSTTDLFQLCTICGGARSALEWLEALTGEDDVGEVDSMGSLFQRACDWLEDRRRGSKTFI